MEHIDLVKFDKSFHGSGWHAPEHYNSADGDIYYRWMASGEASSLSLLSSNDCCCLVDCDIMSIVNDEVLEHLQIEVDGHSVIWTAKASGGNGIRLRFLLPAKPDLEACNVTFFVTKPFVGSEQDVRKLSFAFREIMVCKVNFELLMELLEVGV